MDVMSFGVAVNDRRRNPQTNEWEDYPNFVDCHHVRQSGSQLAPVLVQGHQGGHRGQASLEPMGGAMVRSAASSKSSLTSSNSCRAATGGGAQSYGGDFGGNQGYAPATPAYSAPAPMPAPAPGARAHARCSGYRRLLFRVR